MHFVCYSDGFKRKNVSSEVHSQSEVASIICRKMEENVWCCLNFLENSFQVNFTAKYNPLFPYFNLYNRQIAG